jgi:hypothetical protein
MHRQLCSLVVVVVVAAVSSCAWPAPRSPPADAGVVDPVVDAGPAVITDVPTGPRQNLRWRTGWPLQQHLMQALALEEAEVCNELGVFPCVVRPAVERPFRASGTPTGRAVPHLVALGGNEPFDQGQYTASHTPGATTSVAFDRVVLAACDARVEKDRAGPPAVFTGIDLAAAGTSAADADVVAGTLFSRFHLRDPSAGEREHVRELIVDDGGAAVATADFALAACVAVGSMSESIFD